MTCERAREWIVDELVQALAPEERRALDAHLAGCGACTLAREETVRLWADLPEAAALPEPSRGLTALEERVVAEFGEPRSGRRSEGGSRRRLGYAGAAAALLTVGVLAGALLERSRVESEPGTTAEPGATPAAGAEDDETPRFLLLVYTAPGETVQSPEASDEIGEWARELFREGVVEDGGGLAEARAWAGPADSGTVGNRRMTHFIRIRAADLSEARRIAATLPLTARGGLVEVRPIR